MKKNILIFLLFPFYCIGQDLIITSITGTNSFGTNDIFSGAVTTIKNTGIIDIDATVYVKFYFSNDSVLDVQDAEVSSGFSQGLIKAGEAKTLPYYSGAKQITLPVGTYNLIAVVDSYNYVIETDETNNKFTVNGYTVNASNFDFSFTSFIGPSNANTLDSFQVQFGITNPGYYSSVNRLFTSFYLSQDQTLNAGDQYCGKYSNWLNQPLQSTEGYPYVDQLQIPIVNPGQYYIIAKIDADNQYQEINEANNEAVSGIVNVLAGHPDISLTSVDVSMSGNDYGNIDITMMNIGSTGAANVDQFYAMLVPENGNTQPLYLNLYEKTYLASGGFGFTSFSFSTSSLTPFNNYHVFVGVEYPTDSNPTNNSITSTNTIQVGTPRDITITNASITGKYDPNDIQFNGTVQFKNNVSNYFSDAVPYQITIQNSLNQVVFTKLMSQNIFVNAGQTTSSNWSFTLNNPLPLGAYSATLSCADPFICKSSSINFSFAVDQSLHTLSGIIQGEDGVPLTNGKLFLYQKKPNAVTSFIQKIDPINSSNFTFNLDNEDHTLYFIPDRGTYPDYVPTIFGKTVILSGNNFFSITKDSTVVFEILKINPFIQGSQVIEGNVSTDGSNSSGRKSGRQANEGIIVLLLNGQGEVIAITETDANGNYIFSNLPASTYSVLIPFQLDQPQLMNAPVLVDVTTSSKDVSFNFSNGPVIISSKSLQTIQFEQLSPVSYTSGPILLSGSSSSGLPVSYESSDLSVATIMNDQVTIVGAGTATITAAQNGNSEFKAASSVSQSLQINKADQSITLLSALPDMYSNEPSFSLEAISTSGLPVTFSISKGSDVATITGTTLSLTGQAGDVTIVANQNGNNNYNVAEPIFKTFKVSLILSASEAIQLTAAPNPTNRMIKIRSSIPFKAVGLSDLLGKVTMQGQNSVENELDMDLSGYTAGIYFLHIELENGMNKQVKIIKHP